MEVQKDENGNIFFTYKLKNGGISKSYGIDLIQKMNFPKEIVSKAIEME